MRTRSKLGMLLAAIACAGVVAPQVQAEVIIDLFDQDQYVVDRSDDAGGDAVFAGPALTNVIGGTRDLYVLASNVAGDLPSKSEIDIVSGTLFYEATPDTGNTVGQVIWDGGADGTLDIAGLASTDLALNGEDRFLVVSEPLQQRDSEITIEVWDMDGDLATGVLAVVGSNTDPLASTHRYLNFSSFTNFANVNFSDVGAIRFSFSDDVRITSVSTVVPVPPAVGLGLLGMFIVGGIRRRKNKVQA